MSGYEPEIIASCTCGWESAVYRTGAGAQDAYDCHALNHPPVCETCGTAMRPLDQTGQRWSCPEHHAL